MNFCLPAMVHNHIDVSPRLKFPLPVAHGWEWDNDEERATDSIVDDLL